MSSKPAAMGRLEISSLREAWNGEATDFTPLLALQLDDVGRAIGVDLVSDGKTEVAIVGSRRIDIVASGIDGSQYVIENQYGVSNHDHLTRGLAYAVASHARGLIVIAEVHRDEFRAVADYLNALAAKDPESGVAVWLVEVNAVRIGNSAWAPLFSAVASPNSFTASVEGEEAGRRRRLSREQFEDRFDSEVSLSVVMKVVEQWEKSGDHRCRFMAQPVQVVLECRGPGVGGWRSVVGIYPNGQVAVPLSSYGGQHSGIGVDALSTEEFRSYAAQVFGLKGTESQAKTPQGWLTEERRLEFVEFCQRVAREYGGALECSDDE